jgi:hypothetical protein
VERARMVEDRLEVTFGPAVPGAAAAGTEGTGA